MPAQTKAEHTRALRYKRPALASMGYEHMVAELYEISEACSDVRWIADGDTDTLTAALDGNDDEAFEFRMAFADLDAKAEQLQGLLNDYVVRDEYDDCTVALIGNRYRTLGFDGEEEDYMALTGYEQELANADAGKRLMRHTKAEMISTIGQCFGALVAFLDLRQAYDYLATTMDILRDQNRTLLDQVREVERLYNEADAADFRPWEPATKRYEAAVDAISDKMWIE